MKNLYIGLENEIAIFTDGCFCRDTGDFVRRIAKKAGLKNKISVGWKRHLLKTGNALYDDHNVVELLTPPIRINEGFAMRLADSITLVRDKLVSLLPEKKCTGYSMHWNLSRRHYCPEPRDYWAGIAIPFLLFGLNPLSCGANLRANRSGYCDEKTGRLEILGESIRGREQIAATALLLGAYHLAWANGDRSPLRMSGFVNVTDLKISRFDNQNWRRDILFEVIAPPIQGVEFLKAQKVLEVTHQWLRPYIAKLGTEEDSKYLKEFVEGSKILEIDEKEKFGRINEFSQIRNGLIYPNSGMSIENSGRQINLPLENRLMVLIGNMPGLISLDWHKVYSERIKVSGVDNVYAVGEKLAADKGKDYSLVHTPSEIIPVPKSQINKLLLEAGF